MALCRCSWLCHCTNCIAHCRPANCNLYAHAPEWLHEGVSGDCE
jgi:hypothetical protein